MIKTLLSGSPADLKGPVALRRRVTPGLPLSNKQNAIVVRISSS